MSRKKKSVKHQELQMLMPVRRIREKVVLRVVSKTLIPFILLFAFYVQFHGDFGPGGGFQAGVIFAAAFILFGLIYGLEALRRVAIPRLIEVGIALGVLIFGGVGLWTMIQGGNFLEYGYFLGDHHSDGVHWSHGQHWGIITIEAGVGITVAACMIAIFDAFAGREKIE